MMRIEEEEACSYDKSDNESVHSWQSDETAIVRDSGDDWDPTSEEEENSEYDLVTDNSQVSCCFTEGSSSDIQDVRMDYPEPKLPTCGLDGDESDWESSIERSSTPPSPVTWKCLKCGTATIPPMRFCQICYQKRKGSLPPRPKHRGSIDSGQTSSPSLQHEQQQFPGISSVHNLVTSYKTEDICSLCGERTRNGGFLHNNSVHSVFCYLCTKVLLSRGSKCPICRRTVQKAVRIFE